MAGALETTVPMYIVHGNLYKEAFSEELCTENIAHRRHCTKKSFVPRISACATKLLWHENCLMLLWHLVKLGSLNFRVGAKFHPYIGGLGQVQAAEEPRSRKGTKRKRKKMPVRRKGL